MNRFKKWQYQMAAKQLIPVLTKKCYDAHYAETLEEAKQIALDMIPKGAKVAVGGSETLNQMEMLEVFRSGDYNFVDRYVPNQTREEHHDLYRQGLTCDFLVTSTNAITRNAELVNIDSAGNRIAGMMYGPDRVIVIITANKVCNTLEDAYRRAKACAPLNALRWNHKTPCVETGVCCEEKCTTRDRMCNNIGIITNCQKHPQRISVIMVADRAGF